MTVSYNIGGVWEDVELIEQLEGGVWYETESIEENIGGVWEESYNASSERGRAYFPGSAYLSLADSTDFEYGSGDYCIEYLIMPASLSARGGLVAKHGAGTYYEYYTRLETTGAITNRASTSGTSWNLNQATPASGYLSVGTLYHIAHVKNGTAVKTYINGVSQVLNTLSGTLVAGSNELWIGRDDTDYIVGYLYGIRITKGDARYTATFTPPDDFSVDSENVKLCLRFAESLGATTFIDDTGKTVTTHGNVEIVAR